MHVLRFILCMYSMYSMHVFYACILCMNWNLFFVFILCIYYIYSLQPFSSDIHIKLRDKGTH